MASKKKESSKSPKASKKETEPKATVTPEEKPKKPRSKKAASAEEPALAEPGPRELTADELQVTPEEVSPADLPWIRYDTEVDENQREKGFPEDLPPSPATITPSAARQIAARSNKAYYTEYNKAVKEGKSDDEAKVRAVMAYNKAQELLRQTVLSGGSLDVLSEAGKQRRKKLAERRAKKSPTRSTASMEMSGANPQLAEAVSKAEPLGEVTSGAVPSVVGPNATIGGVLMEKSTALADAIRAENLKKIEELSKILPGTVAGAKSMAERAVDDGYARTQEAEKLIFGNASSYRPSEVQRSLNMWSVNSPLSYQNPDMLIRNQLAAVANDPSLIHDELVTKVPGMAAELRSEGIRLPEVKVDAEGNRQPGLMYGGPYSSDRVRAYVLQKYMDSGKSAKEANEIADAHTNNDLTSLSKYGVTESAHNTLMGEAVKLAKDHAKDNPGAPTALGNASPENIAAFNARRRQRLGINPVLHKQLMELAPMVETEDGGRRVNTDALVERAATVAAETSTDVKSLTIYDQAASKVIARATAKGESDAESIARTAHEAGANAVRDNFIKKVYISARDSMKNLRRAEVYGDTPPILKPENRVNKIINPELFAGLTDKERALADAHARELAEKTGDTIDVVGKTESDYLFKAGRTPAKGPDNRVNRAIGVPEVDFGDVPQSVFEEAKASGKNVNDVIEEKLLEASRQGILVPSEIQGFDKKGRPVQEKPIRGTPVINPFTGNLGTSSDVLGEIMSRRSGAAASRDKLLKEAHAEGTKAVSSGLDKFLEDKPHIEEWSESTGSPWSDHPEVRSWITTNADKLYQDAAESYRTTKLEETTSKATTPGSSEGTLEDADDALAEYARVKSEIGGQRMPQKHLIKMPGSDVVESSGLAGKGKKALEDIGEFVSLTSTDESGAVSANVSALERIKGLKEDSLQDYINQGYKEVFVVNPEKGKLIPQEGGTLSIQRKLQTRRNPQGSAVYVPPSIDSKEDNIRRLMQELPGDVIHQSAKRQGRVDPTAAQVPKVPFGEAEQDYMPVGSEKMTQAAKWHLNQVQQAMGLVKPGRIGRRRAMMTGESLQEDVNAKLLEQHSYDVVEARALGKEEPKVPQLGVPIRAESELGGQLIQEAMGDYLEKKSQEEGPKIEARLKEQEGYKDAYEKYRSTTLKNPVQRAISDYSDEISTQTSSIQSAANRIHRSIQSEADLIATEDLSTDEEKARKLSDLIDFHMDQVSMEGGLASYGVPSVHHESALSNKELLKGALTERISRVHGVGIDYNKRMTPEAVETSLWKKSAPEIQRRVDVLHGTKRGEPTKVTPEVIGSARANMPPIMNIGEFITKEKRVSELQERKSARQKESEAKEAAVEEFKTSPKYAEERSFMKNLPLSEQGFTMTRTQFGGAVWGSGTIEYEIRQKGLESVVGRIQAKMFYRSPEGKKVLQEGKASREAASARSVEFKKQHEETVRNYPKPGAMPEDERAARGLWGTNETPRIEQGFLDTAAKEGVRPLGRQFIPGLGVQRVGSAMTLNMKPGSIGVFETPQDFPEERASQQRIQDVAQNRRNRQKAAESVQFSPAAQSEIEFGVSSHKNLVNQALGHREAHQTLMKTPTAGMSRDELTAHTAKIEETRAAYHSTRDKARKLSAEEGINFRSYGVPGQEDFFAR